VGAPLARLPRRRRPGLTGSVPSELRGERARIRALGLGDAAELLDLRRVNAEFLAPREPVRPADYLTLAGQEAELRAVAADRTADRGYAFAILPGAEERMVGRIALSSIVRGPFQNAYLGYFVAEAEGGRGYATDAVRLTCAFAFEAVRLHRVQAAVMLDNPASMRVLEKAGFRREGLARRYLRIAGAWADHALFARTAEDHRAGASQP
jgi:ribosomal-protein-alanine N-acetyltransferase